MYRVQFRRLLHPSAFVFTRYSHCVVWQCHAVRTVMRRCDCHEALSQVENNATAYGCGAIRTCCSCSTGQTVQCTVRRAGTGRSGRRVIAISQVGTYSRHSLIVLSSRAPALQRPPCSPYLWTIRRYPTKREWQGNVIILGPLKRHSSVPH